MNREDWETAADRLLAAVVPYATDGFAQYRLPGRPSHSGPVSDGLEGYARTFLIAAFRLAGANGNAPGTILERYRDGLVAGTDPGHPFAWPPLADMTQQLVEAASIALALHETRPWLFDRLAPAERQRVVDWLAGIVGKRTPDNNWVLFRVIVEQFLKNVGGPHDPAEITGGLDRIERWYAGDGWYTDGDGQNFDYYAGWALHLYPVLWSRMSGDTSRDYAGRLAAYLDGFQHFFAPDGAPVFQGRSLTYRFAAVAPLWLGALAGATPLPPGRTRRIASAALRHFRDHGAPDDRGLLTLGWHHPFPPMVQPYSGPASPYWAAKAFLGLLLPPDHPVWTADEDPAPIERSDLVIPLPAPGWLLHGTTTDGVIRLLNHGSDRATRTAAPDPNYVRLAYSTHTGPQFDGEPPIDNHVAVISPDGTVSQRRHIQRLGVADRFAASAYASNQATIVTAAVAHASSEVRIHAVTARPGSRIRDGAHALAAPHPPTAEVLGAALEEQHTAEVRRTASGEQQTAGVGGPGWGELHTAGVGGPALGGRPVPAPVGPAAWVRRPDGLVSGITALTGFTTAAVHRTEGADAFGRHAAIPYLECDSHPGGTHVYIAQITLTRTTPEPPTSSSTGATGRAAEAPAPVTPASTVLLTPETVEVVELDGATVTLRWPDGDSVTVDLGERPRYERRDASGAVVARWQATQAQNNDATRAPDN